MNGNEYKKYASGQPCPIAYSVKEAERNVTSFLQQLERSEKIIYKTRDLETFFHRYGYALFLVTELVKIEACISVQGESPVKRKEALLEQKQDAIRKLIDRLCEKLDTKISKVKTKESVDRNITWMREDIKKYKQEMSEETFAYIDVALDSVQQKYDAIYQNR